MPTNPDLFKPRSARSQSRASSAGRRVSFQEGPPEEIKVQYPQSPVPEVGSTDSPVVRKSNKWQPLATVEPSPVAAHDPFSLGDSDDDERRDTNKAVKVPADEIEAKKSDKTVT